MMDCCEISDWYKLISPSIFSINCAFSIIIIAQVRLAVSPREIQRVLDEQNIECPTWVRKALEGWLK